MKVRQGSFKPVGWSTLPACLVSSTITSLKEEEEVEVHEEEEDEEKTALKPCTDTESNILKCINTRSRG